MPKATPTSPTGELGSSWPPSNPGALKSQLANARGDPSVKPSRALAVNDIAILAHVQYSLRWGLHCNVTHTHTLTLEKQTSRVL